MNRGEKGSERQTRNKRLASRERESRMLQEWTGVRREVNVR